MSITPQDLTGKRFGWLVVISTAARSSTGELQWQCQCDCGRTKVVRGGALYTGRTRSCGCLPRGRAIVNLSGQRFGRLIVLHQVGRNRHNQPQWLCQCDCGQTIVIRGCNLTSKNTRSCGCLLRETIIKHGMTQTPTYQSWCGMIARCTYPKDSEWERYGKRGIKVCERWLKFENFFADMGTRPLGRSLDRINPDGDYCKGNCRWATATQQANNKRNSHFLTFQGEKKTVTEWARQLGIGHSTLCYRLQAGWSVEQALTQPVNTQFGPKAKKKRQTKT